MTAMLILGMDTAVTAANAAPKAYASAKDGELLYHLNFNDTAVFNPKGNDAAEKYYTYSVGDNGSSLTIRGTNKDVDGTLIATPDGFPAPMIPRPTTALPSITHTSCACSPPLPRIGSVSS